MNRQGTAAAPSSQRGAIVVPRVNDCVHELATHFCSCACRMISYRSRCASRSCANSRSARTFPIAWSTIGRCGSAIRTEPVCCASSIGTIDSGATKRRFLQPKTARRYASAKTARAAPATSRACSCAWTSKPFTIRKLAEMHLEAKTPNLLLVDSDSSVSSIYKFHTETVVPVRPARDRRRARLVRQRSATARQGFRCRRSAGGLTVDVARRWPASILSPRGHRSGLPNDRYLADHANDDPLLDFQEAVSLVEPDASAEYDAATGKDPAPARLRRTERLRGMGCPRRFTKGLLHFVRETPGLPFDRTLDHSN
jgi:hypothetical protein